MIQILFSLLVLLLSFRITFADECLYNQAVYKDMYDELTKQYSNSKYVTLEEDKKALEIRFPESTLLIWYGGCEHYGTQLEYYSTIEEGFHDRSQLFTKVVELIALFGQHMVKPERLQEILDSNHYQEIAPNDYLVRYPSMDWFEIAHRTENAKAHISITFWN